VHTERRGVALVVRIDHQARANAVTHEMLGTLASLLHGPAVDEVAAVLLAGAGERHFCAGLDLASVAESALPEHLRRGESLLFAASQAIAECRRPVIAVVGGAALGGGLELAMACDWRIAARGARLGMPAARLGVVYEPRGLRRAVALMGPARARRLFLTARPVSADEAMALGLVDELVSPADLWGAAERAAADVAACSRTAVEGTRAIIRAIEEEPLGADVAGIAERRRARAFGGPDLAEGLRAFAEGRPARFLPGDAAAPPAARD
jgi:enoyl-CoA hydratase/carnithine racemase